MAPAAPAVSPLRVDGRWALHEMLCSVPSDSDLWRLTFEHSPIGVALVGLEGQTLTVNPAMCDLLGYAAAELVHREFTELTHPADLAADLELFGQARAGDIDTYRIRKRYLHRSGRTVWCDLSVALVRDGEARPSHFLSQVLDMTEQRESEERLVTVSASAQRDRQALEAIFETVGVGLVYIGRDGEYQQMNQRHRESVSIPFPNGHRGRAGQVGEVYLLDGQTPLTTEQMPSTRAVNGEEFDDLILWVGNDPAHRLAYSVSARQVKDVAGDSQGAILAYQDVTDLLRALHVQDEFVSSVSHELRTPLASVLGYLELISEHDLPEEVKRQVGIVERNASRLQSLVTDLLDVAQTEEVALRLDVGPVELVTLAGEAVQACAPAAAARGLELYVEAPDALVVAVDEQRLRQVLDNLLSNAIKYSATSGTVGLIVRLEADGVTIAVRDSGPGLPAREVARVFDRFYRGASALQHHLPGTGLGLNIVRAIVEAHGGSVVLDSEVGRGCTFTVTLPHALAVRPVAADG